MPTGQTDGSVTALEDVMASIDAAAFGEIIAIVDQLGANQGKPASIAIYRRWIATRPPGHEMLPAAWFNLGVELGRANDQAGAAQAYRSALGVRPDFHHAAINLGLLLEQHGQPDAALRLWKQTVQDNEARTSLLNQQARLLEKTGRFNEAERLLRDSLLTDPAQPDAVQHWVHLRQRTCRWPALAEVIPGLSSDELLGQCGPLAALALTDRVAEQKAIAARWLGRKTVPVPERLSPPKGYRHDRIRLGYLSSDFCRHAMSYLIAELFERHDRSRFELFGYCSSPDDGSDLRARVIGAFDHYRPIRDLADEAAARLIRNDEIDILIDLNGLTSGARLQILRWRPAPIQATYLGFIGPVPLPERDHRFCDEFVVPADVAALYEPAALAIARNYQANDSKREIGAPMNRADVGLPDNRFVFCCFSNHYKITPEIFGAWIDILRGTGDSVLWLVTDNPWSCENLRAKAAAAGIDPARIIFADRTDPAQYMARLPLADMFLDTFPYNAGTVASDAIRMGLPLVTLCGQSYASRMAGSLLNTLGATQGITDSLPGYVGTASSLANDPVAYRAYRALFSAERWRATIGDIDGFTREFEATLSGLAEQLQRE